MTGLRIWIARSKSPDLTRSRASSSGAAKWVAAVSAGEAGCRCANTAVGTEARSITSTKRTGRHRDPPSARIMGDLRWPRPARRESGRRGPDYSQTGAPGTGRDDAHGAHGPGQALAPVG